MKKILIIIHDMEIGGAQKSLLSFLQVLASCQRMEQFEVHLMPIKPSGAFYSQIPKQIKVIQPPKELRWLGSKFNVSLLCKHGSFRALLGEVFWLIRSKFNLFPAEYNTQQRLWLCWKFFVPVCANQYDVIVSYMDGVPNYYAMDKIQANKKVLWVHSEYQKQKYNPEYDKIYFEKCDRIITISEQCRKCILQNFPFAKYKTHVLENISSNMQIIQKSLEHSAVEFSSGCGWKFLSVGRLHYQKGFDLAIKAAKIIRDAGYGFVWLIVGEGAERDNLQKMIDFNGLSEHIKLIGARTNPYVYMRECDIVVQTSRVEGKSIVLDEAKILCKPIVVTNYTTVHDTIEHKKNGWIVDMTPESVAQGIIELCENDSDIKKLKNNLKKNSKDNVHELQKYINIMF